MEGNDYLGNRFLLLSGFPFALTKMLDKQSQLNAWSPGRPFYLGLAIVLLANGLPFIPSWYTFIHMWRVELAASVFLASTLIYLYFKKGPVLELSSPDELKFVVLPMLALILWSAISAFWAPSWKSALHHSLIWAEYLIFYLLFSRLLNSGANFRKLLALFVLALVYFAIPAIVEYCGYMAFGGPTTTLGMRFAKFGEQAVTLLPIALLFVVRSKGKIFVLGTAALTLVWLLVFCSFGRVNYFLFGSVVLCIFGCLLISRPHRRHVPKFALVIVLLAISPLPLQLFSVLNPGPSTSAMTRLSDTSGLNASGNFRKLMLSISGEMIAAHPLTGVGADNFGMQVNSYRETYGAAHPDDVNLAGAEDQIPAHAHNEFLQIVVELGAVGGAIMLWLLAGIALMAYRSLRRLRSGSLFGPAAVLGLGMFIVSSAVSAYSFRVMQNGIVFFFVLAFAARHLLRLRENEASETSFQVSPKFALAAGLLVCFGLTLYSAVRVTSVIVATRANQTRPLNNAVPLYELAMRLDDENPDVRANYGMRLFRARRYNEAIPYLQSAVSIGRAPSGELSYLASTQALAGDAAGAERTMAFAASMYPRSPFVLTRYALVLENNGKNAEAVDTFERALAIDRRSSNTWRALISSGPKAVSELAARDPEYYPVMELKPQGSIYAVVTERFIRFPEEKRFSLSTAMVDEE